MPLIRHDDASDPPRQTFGGYDALVTPECGHTMGQCGLPIAGRRSCRYRACKSMRANQISSAHRDRHHPHYLQQHEMWALRYLEGSYFRGIITLSVLFIFFISGWTIASLFKVTTLEPNHSKHRILTVALFLWWRSDQDPDALQNDLDRALETQPLILKCAYVWQMWKFVGILGLILVEAIFFLY